MKQFFIFFLILSGCSLGPDHETPTVWVPHQFEEAPQEQEEMCLSLWWEQFHDKMLSELIDEALSCNYDMNIALFKIEEFRARYKIDRSFLYPQIQANFIEVRARRSGNVSEDVTLETGSATDIPLNDFSGPPIINFYQLGFDASWEIDLWGKNRRRAEVGYRGFEASQEDALDIQISLIADVAQTYIDIRSLQQQIRAIKEQINRRAELLELTEVRYRAGLISHLDVAQAKARLDGSQAGLPRFEKQLKQTLHGLAILLGKPPENFEIGIGEIPKAKGVIPNDLPSTLLCRRPDIRRADRELAAQTSRIGVAIAGLFPSFSLIGDFGFQSNDISNFLVWPSRFWTIGPNMIWNLFTGGRLITQIKVEKEIQKQAILKYEKTVIQSLQEVEDRLIGYFKEESRLENLEEKLASNSYILELTMDRYLAGLVPFDNVLEAEDTFYISEEEMIESQGTLMVQLVGLYKALGGGWQCFDLP
ncbi:MAG: TolC family protein [Simkaniaceae bacterium]|nr:TolC family protein [Candidatus Sacchlamyda saccharinae]